MVCTIDRTFRWFAGLALAAWLAGGAPAPAAADDDVAPAAHVATDDDGPFHASRLVRQLMRRRGGDPAAAAQLVQMVRPLPDDEGAEAFDILAEAHRLAGHLNLAAETRRLLIEQFPEQPRAAAARLWLVRLYASSEVALAARRAAGAETTGDADRGLATYAMHLADYQTEATESAAPADGALAFQRAAAARRAGQIKIAERTLTPLKHRRADDPWAVCARAEAWLADPRDKAPPKPAARCAPAATPPQLDGVLDDACWQENAPLSLASEDDDDPAGVIRLAYDDEYLYFAVSCPQLSGASYVRDLRPRAHDGAAPRHDLVRLRLDADRDYATWFALAVDSRGWTADACWDDAAWNPAWYVAAAAPVDRPDAAWVVEAAIPWAELADVAPRAGDAWAVAIDRQTPAADPQGWPASPAVAEGPQQFGLLLFE